MSQDPDQVESPIDAQLAAPPQPVQDQGPVYEPAGTRKDFFQSKAAVLATLFLVTGFLGVPLLWINRQFTQAERILWTIVVTIYTLALIAGVGMIIWWAYRQIQGI